jgi:hypothetical protein
LGGRHSFYAYPLQEVPHAAYEKSRANVAAVPGKISLCLTLRNVAGRGDCVGADFDPGYSRGEDASRAVNPITKTNWEGTGVEPDVKVNAADAMQRAEELAATKLSQGK